LTKQRKQIARDLHYAIRKKEQYDAQTRLNKMRQQRIQAEMAANYLIEQQKKQ
jgi:hypothetical protein